MPFVEKLGLYQGDLWYFQNNYGPFISKSFFYPIEYPAGYILILKLNYLLSLLFGGFNYLNFIYANRLLMIPLTIVCAFLIKEIAQTLHFKKSLALLYLFVSPTFFIASTTNYDLYPIFLTLLSVYCLLRNKNFLSFFFLGIGTAIKLYPAFLVPLFILYLLNKKINLPTIVRSFSGFFISFLTINLPFVFYNFTYWIFPYSWQSQNPQKNDPNTFSYLLSLIHLEFLRLPFFFAILLLAFFLSIKIYKKNRLSDKAFIYLIYFTLFSAVFGNQVNTPQYTLWFLPFTAITAFPLFPLWWVGDAVNSTILFFYFQLSNHHIDIKLHIFSFMVVYFFLIYIFLLYTIKKNFYD